MSHSETVFFIIVTPLALAALFETWRRDRKQRRARLYFLCQRCRKWTRSVEGIPNECPCGWKVL